ncbi:MAG: hypothetical protein ABIQ32_01500 [Sphingomicrobium sp.]
MKELSEPIWQATLHDPVAFFTACLVVVTGGLWVFTARLWRATVNMGSDAKEIAQAQGEKMERSIAEAATAAKAMERQNDIAADTAHAELRAYLDFDGVRFLRDEELDTPEEVGAGISITLKNYGKTPANRITMETTYLVVAEHLDAHKVAFDADKQFSYIMPSDHATSHGRFMMPRMIWEAINLRLAQVRVSAEVNYVDYLNDPHSLECVFENHGVTEEFGFIAGTRKAA